MTQQTTEPRLIIFDVDGTLSDSQGDIAGAMAQAFQSQDMTPPPHDAVLSIVGLSLDVAMPRLAPEADEATCIALVAAYKQAYMQRRLEAGAAHSPLYPGIRELLNQLAAEPQTILGIATGKSRRGLLALLENHGLSGMFHTIQVADDHPSKPHPSMVMTALMEAGVPAERAVMIGDTSFDIDMARAAGVASIAVGWGYHPATALEAAKGQAADMAALRSEIDRLTGGPA